MEKNSRHHIHPEGQHCRDLLDQLSEFVDGTLDSKLCTEIEEHLKSCRNCTIVIDSLRKTINLYHVTAKTEHMPADVKQRLYKNLNLEAYLNHPPKDQTKPD